MKLLADLHTHSKYSGLFHAKDTIEQMVIAANEMGLEEIAITDHGYKHLCGTNIFNIVKAREEIDEINKWSKTKVLLGIEADIIAEDGTLDIDDDTIPFLDILLIGYHRLIKTDFANFFGGQKKTKEAIKKATNAYINAIDRYPVTAVTHLDSILTTDLYEIGKACAEKGVMVEINNRHTKWTEDQVNDLLASGCMFIVSSDAHKRDSVGHVDRAFKLIKKYNIPSHLIGNVYFEENEKSEDDKEIDEYYSIYQMKQKEKQEKEEAKEVKKKTQFSNSLSDEMETKLREIAKEKGLYYDEIKEDEEDIEIYRKQFDITMLETEDLIKQAKEFLNKNALNEFDSQNAKVEGDDEYIVQEDLNEVVLEKATETQETLEPEVIQPEILEEKPVEKEQSSAEQNVLNTLRGPSAASVAAPKKPIVSKTQTVAVQRPVQKGQSLTNFMESLKEETKAEQKIQAVQEKPSQTQETKSKSTKKKAGGMFVEINTLKDDKK